MTTDREPAPYAPIGNVLSAIRRLRDRGLPNPLTLKELERLGIPTGNTSRTLAALRFLDLVDQDGYHQAAMDRLARASSDEYQEVLAQVIRAAYAQVFAITDPAQDPEFQIHDAFRHFQPAAQRGRMVTLFLGLCRETGIIEGGPITRTRSRTQSRQRPTQQPPMSEQPTSDVQSAASISVLEQNYDEPDYRLLQVVMQRLPRSGRWTRAQRDRWLRSVEANVDLLIDVVDDEGGEA